MNPQIMTKQQLLSLLTLICVAACPSWATADELNANPTSMSFAAGGMIRVELNKGAVEVVGVAGDKITASWHSRSRGDERDVTVKLQRSGELEVHGVAGTLDSELLAGEMDLHVAEPRHYRNVSASVIVGELNARPWRIETGGVWRSFKASGEGEYDLRARLLAGQLTIRSE